MNEFSRAKTHIDAHSMRSLCWERYSVPDRCGVAAVETALVMPVLLSVLLGIVSFGDYLMTAHLVQQSANSAARAALAGIDAAERRRIAITTARQMLDSTGVLHANRGQIDTTERDNILTVSVRYDASSDPLLNLPFVPAFGRTPSASGAAMLGGLS